jgi:hypothetical protein
MRKRLAFVGALVAVLSLAPFAPGSVASACPDPDYPCDPPPHQLPLWCKLTPFC